MSSSSDPISVLSGHQYIKLETQKKNGQAVATPVWISADGKKIFIITRSQTGKVKRLRNNPNVRVAPCGMRGELKGQWFNGKAAFANAQELEYALKLRNKKYGFKTRLAGLFSRAKGKLVGIVIYLDLVSK
jgi:PPOX class probable F420-dependent enzyme